MSFYAFSITYRFCFVSTLNEKAAAAAENTEKSSGALILLEKAMASANNTSKIPLPCAVSRVLKLNNNAMPKISSSAVATAAATETSGDGSPGSNDAVYWTNLSQLPQAECAAPHRPNRSATADKKPALRAIRKNQVAIFSSVNFITV